jgi:lipoyl(octanoyl) transferase
MLIAALARLDLVATRIPGLTGVWTQGRKIASIGIHVKQWITLHGFALNVSNDLSGFDLIVPCGIENVVMTSIARERGGRDEPAALWAETKAAVVDAFSDSFDREPVAGTLEPDGTVSSHRPF